MDIVERLRSVDISWSQEGEWCAEAADYIERLRGTLKEIADAYIPGVIGDGYTINQWLIKHHTILVNKARAALKE